LRDHVAHLRRLESAATRLPREPSRRAGEVTARSSVRSDRANPDGARVLASALPLGATSLSNAGETAQVDKPENGGSHPG
jgi:hypothetical protein